MVDLLQPDFAVHENLFWQKQDQLITFTKKSDMMAKIRIDLTFCVNSKSAVRNLIGIRNLEISGKHDLYVCYHGKFFSPSEGEM